MHKNHHHPAATDAFLKNIACSCCWTISTAFLNHGPLTSRPVSSCQRMAPGADPAERANRLFIPIWVPGRVTAPAFQTGP